MRFIKIATLFLLLTPCVAQGQTIEIRGTTMGPIPFLVAVASDDHEPEKLEILKNQVNDSLQRVNELMSTYIEDSDISKFNKSNSTDWISVDAETVSVVAKSLEISELTEGAFDPTVGPAVNAWNFGPGKTRNPSPPTADEIAALSSHIGYEKIETRKDPPAIRKSDINTQLDLSAIAKGYAVDRVAQTLAALGYENYMVEVGGEVYANGERSSGGPWNIAVEKPDNSNPLVRSEDNAHRVIKLSGQAIATSGDYRNFFEFEGKRYSHTIDPNTCEPVRHELAIASVVAKDCMTADAMATAVMVMGQKEGAAVCKRLGYPLLTVLRSASEESGFTTDYSVDYPLSDDHALPTDAAGEQPQKNSAKSSTEEMSIVPVFVATFVVFCLMVLGMAVGAIFNNKPVTGSCGGIANMTNEDGESVCGICSKPTADCTEPQAS